MVHYNLSLADAVIVATARCHNLPLVTADKKLERVKEVNIILFTLSSEES